MKKYTHSKQIGVILFVLLMQVSFGTYGQTSAGSINMSNTTINIATGTYITYYDPGGPGSSYGTNDYTQTITAANGEPLVITFTQFALQSNRDQDYLIIHDGPTTASPSLGTYTRSSSPGTIRTSGASVTFEFVTNTNTANDGAGWVATITSMVTTDVDVTTCSATFTDKQGASNYTKNQYYKVTYRTAESGKILRFTFNNMDLGTGDQLKVLDGDSLNARTIITYTSTNIPNTTPFYVYSSGESITFVFSSNDDTNVGSGWNATVDCYTVLTYYSYRNGNWNDGTTWTFDSSGSTDNNTSDLVPTENDKVAIINSHTVTVTNGNNKVVQLDIQEGSTLDVAGTTGHDFGTVSGKGRLKSTRGTLPSGDFSQFTQSGGGTIELYGNITTSPDISFTTFNNLEINATSAGDNINFLYNTQINGYLKINTGSVHFNSTTSRTINVEGNVDVGANGTLDVTRGNHNLYLKGNLNNEGVITFTNLTTLPYAYTNDPGQSVTLTFNNAMKDQELNCNGSTTLNRLIVDKGSNDTYKLSVNASTSSNFKLYGRNDSDYNFPTEPPALDNQKALDVYAGTLLLGSNINIPRLLTTPGTTSQYSFVIDQDAAIILDGATVSVTQQTDQSNIIVYGKLKVMGTSSFSSLGAQGIILREYGIVEIEGNESAPTINTTAFRTSSRTVDGQHRGTLIMSGGIMNISGYNSAYTHPAFALPFPDNTIQISGGTINVNRGSYYGGTDTEESWLVSSNPQNISITGGVVNIYANDGHDARINSTAPFYNLNLISNSSRTISIETVTEQTQAGVITVPAAPLRELIILNNLNINGSAVFNPNNQNVTVGSNFTLNSTGTYTPGVNKTIFNGYGLQAFNNAGAITSGLYDLELTNSSLLTISNDLTIRNDLTIGSETTLRDGDNSISVAGDITNNGLHESTGDGSIILNGTVDQIIEGNGEGVFGNLSLNKTAGTTTQNTSISVTGNLRLANTAAVLNIGSNKLALSATSHIYDNLTTNTQTAFSSSRMIQTAGIQSDLGVEKTYTTTGTTIYPIGVSGKFTRARVEIDAAPTAWGTITINPVNTIHPLATGSNTLNYYWNVRRTEMSGFSPNQIRLKFYYVDGDIIGEEARYRPAFYYPTTWTFTDSTKVTDATNEILFDAIESPRGHFTAGQSSSFGTVKTYYSRQTGNWDDGSDGNYTSWTNDTGTNLPAATLPDESSPVVIRSGHTINVTTNNKRAGSLEIQSNAILDLTTSTGHFFGLIYQTTVSGSGILRISSAASAAEFPGGDFGEFLGENGGTVEYYTTGTQDFTLPTGTAASSVILNEGFEGSFPPSGWSYARNPDDSGGPQWIRTTDRSHTGSASAMHNYGTNQSDLLISPPLNFSTAASYELTFWKNNNWAADYDYFGIWISTTNKEPSSFTEVAVVAAGTEDTWTQYSIDLSSFSGYPQVYVAFVYKGDNADGVYIDDVTISKNFGNFNYHNLITNPAASRTITLPNINLNASGYFTVKGTGITASNNSSATTISVSGKTSIEETGTLRIDNGKAQTFIFYDTLSTANGTSLLVNTAGTSAAAHRLNIYGNVINNGSLNLNPGSSKYANIYFLGTNNQVFSGTGTTANINRVYVNKGTSQTPIANITADVFNMNTSLEQALTITNGTIRFSGTSLTPILTTSSSFTIPTTGCLSVNGSTVTIGNSATDAADVYLSGKLEVMAGTMNIGNPANTNNNDIEYYSAGNPEVAVSGGTLNVNGQIRRPITIATGNLTYRQSGGDVYIYGKKRQTERALLEVLNSGSFYSSGNGNLYLVQGASSANNIVPGELYLRPATYSVTGGTIHAGTSATAATTNYFNLYLESPIWSLTVNGETNAKYAVLNTYPATIKGNLVIGTEGQLGASYFNTSKLDVNIGGNLINYSTANYPYWHNNNNHLQISTQITRFTGVAPVQNIINVGSNFFRIGNVVIDNPNAGGNVIFSGTKSFIVFGDLNITQGILTTDNIPIILMANLINHATHESINNGYLSFYNNSSISGTNGSSVGKISISGGKAVTSSISFTINTNLTLGSNSKLNIGDNLLIFGSSATTTGVTPTAYILTNGALSDLGVRKEYAAAGSFTFPIGVGSEGGKYTPVTMNVTNTGGVAGTITVKPVDEAHPMRTEMVLDDELQYFWNVTSTGFSNPTVSHSYKYSDLDILGTESTYVNARMYDFTWYSQTEVIDITNNLIKFTGVNYIDGEYTAGAVGNWGTIHKYYSTGNGNWDNASSWRLDSLTGPIAGTPPNGNPVYILSPHTITTNHNEAYAGSVDIASGATLDIGTTDGHRLGHITGGGTIRIEATGTPGYFVFPGGDPSEFMNTTGSTVEYSGAGTLPANIETYQNILFSGNGNKIVPATDITVLGNLTISNGKLDNGTNNRKITLYGNWNSSVSGGYIYGSSTVVLAGGNSQTITATGGETFYNLTVNKTAGTIATLNSTLNVTRLLTLTSGIINSETNLLTLSWGDPNAVSGGSTSSYIDGPLRKLVYNSGTFNFPVGDDGRYGPVYISGVNSGGTNQYWTGRYYNVAPSDNTNLTAPLHLISNNEYWEVTGVSGTSANVRLRWDSNSQIIPATAIEREKIRVAEYQPPWTIVGSTIVDGGQTSGTVGTSTPIGYLGVAKKFTIGLEVLASGQITGTNASVCDDGTTMPVTFVVAGDEPLKLYYLINGANRDSLTNLTAGSHVVNFTYDDLYAISGAGDYVITIDEVLDKNKLNGIILSGDATLTLYPTPSPIISGPTSVMIEKSNNFSVTNNGNSYFWSVISGGTSVSLITNENTPTVTITWSGTPGTVVLQLVETTPAPNICSTTVTYEVSVRDWPVIVGNFNVCANAEEVYYSKEVTGHTYNWTVVGGTITDGTGTSSIKVLWSAETAGIITLEQGTSVPYTEISQNVTINPAPTANLSIVGSANICDEEGITLSLGGSGIGTYYTFYLNLDGTEIDHIDETVAITNPYNYVVTADKIPWTTGGPSHDYTFSLQVVNDNTGCRSTWDNEIVSVWKKPETGPEYHIPNNYGF